MKEKFYDLHIHTVYSDGTATPKEAVMAAKRLNIGIAITDHNHVKGGILASRIAKNEGVECIIGTELGTNEGKELLIYFNSKEGANEFYEREIKPYRTARMTRISRSMWDFVGEKYELLKKRYGVKFCVLPHPYAPLYKNINSDLMLGKAMLEVVDGVEGINASMNTSANQKACELGLRHAKFLTAGSDAHLKSVIGVVTTKLWAENGAVKSSISHNISKFELFKNSLSLLQITKENFRYSMLNKRR